MRSLSHFRLIPVTAFLFLMISIGSFVPPGFLSATAYASAVSLRSDGKSSLGAAASTCGTWSVVPGANPGSLNNVFYGATAISSNNIWAVGEYANYLSGHSYRTLTEQWNGTTWNVVSSPNPVQYNNELQAVAAVSSSDVWAVGIYNPANQFSSQTLIEHWNGRRWKIIPSPNPGQNLNDLYAVAVVSTRDVWTVGSADANTLIEHWDGTSWNVVPSPSDASNINALLGVTAISASNIWAVGYDGGQTLIEHWDGTIWSIVPSGSSTAGSLNGVTVVSASDIWAVGNAGSSTLVEHWDGTSWSVVPSPNPVGTPQVTLNAVTAVSSTDVWAAGYYYNSSYKKLTLIEHWDGTSWSIVPSPNVGAKLVDILYSITSVPGSSTVWTVGNYAASGGKHPLHNTLTEFYC